MPSRAMRDAAETAVALDTLQPGDWVLLATGEPVPVDGRIRSGSISVDQQQLTGESVPRALGVGGTLVLRGKAQVEVSVAGRTLSRLN